MALSDALDDIKDGADDLKGASKDFNKSHGKFKKSSKSIIKAAKGNIFEFPVFASSSVPLDYATASVSLVEQVYASYLQMAISINPIIDDEMARKGAQFDHLRSDTNKYLECVDPTDMPYAYDACHNVITEGGIQCEFNLVNIEDSMARIINEAVDHQPLSEFDHFFQESYVGDGAGFFDGCEFIQEATDVPPYTPPGVSVDIETYIRAMYAKSLKKYQCSNWDTYRINQLESMGATIDRNAKDLDKEIQKAVDQINSQLNNSPDKINKHNEHLEQFIRTERAEQELKLLNEKINDPDDPSKQITRAEYRARVEDKTVKEVRDKAETQAEEARKRLADYEGDHALDMLLKGAQLTSQMTETEIKELQKKWAKEDRSALKAKLNADMAKAINDAVKSVDDNRKAEAEANLSEKKDRDYDEDRELKNKKTSAEISKTEHEVEKMEREDRWAKEDRELDRMKKMNDARVKTPQFLDETKIQKLNTMKPLMMSVDLNVVDKNGSLSRPVSYVIGVKCHTRLIDADILPEVAAYPLKEMNKKLRKVKWRAGELKFGRDILWKKTSKKQTASDSRDPKRKWYRRLYELAHMSGDGTAAASIKNGKSPWANWWQDKLTGGNNKDVGHGLIPNATIIMSKSDIDNIKREKDIDLLSGSKASKFCKELFLIGLIVIDDDKEAVKVMFPDLHDDYEVHSLAAIKKQLATLDTAGTKTRDIMKILG